MKKLFRICSFVFLVSALPVFAQNVEYSSSRLDTLAANLKRQTVDLADRAYRDFKNRNNNIRTNTDQVFLAQQMDSSAYLFQEMVRDNRQATELRDAAAILGDLSRRAPSYGGSNYLWRDVQRTIADIDRELGNYGGGTPGNYPGPGNFPGGGGNDYAGRVIWRGTVDGIVQLDVLGRALGVRTISGADYGSGTYNFTSALPQNRDVQVYVTKRRGRGDVRIVQQPSRNNNGGAVIEIRDNAPGAQEYELEIYWR